MNKTLMVMMISLLGIITACTARKTVQTDVKVKDSEPVTTEIPSAETLETGKSIYGSKCTKCHGLKNPKHYSVDELRSIVPGMVTKVNKDEELITQDDESILLQYLIHQSH